MNFRILPLANTLLAKSKVLKNSRRSRNILITLLLGWLTYQSVVSLLFPHIPWESVFGERTISRVYQDVFYPSRKLQRINDDQLVSFIKSQEDASLVILRAASSEVADLYPIQHYYDWTASKLMCELYLKPKNMLVDMKGKGEVCTTSRNVSFYPRALRKSYVTDVVRKNMPNSDNILSYVSVFRNALLTQAGEVVVNNSLIKIAMCDLYDGKLEISRKGYLTQPLSEVFVISQFWGDGVFHSLTENIARIMPYLKFLKSNPNILIHAYPTKVTKTVLTELGIDTSRIITGTYLVKKLFLPENMFCGNPHPFHMQLLSRELSRNVVEKQNAILYIKRRQEIFRHFTYEKKIREVVVKRAAEYGFELLEFSDNPLPSQSQIRSMFRRAAVIVAPHGAGETNLIFSSPGTIVIEGLCNYQHLNMCYRHLAYILGLRYHGIPGTKGCERYINTKPDEIDSALKFYLGMLKKHKDENKFEELFLSRRTKEIPYSVDVIGKDDFSFSSFKVSTI